MKRLSFAILGFSWMLLLSGCISYAHHELQSPVGLHESAALQTRKTLYLRVTGEHFANGTPQGERSLAYIEKWVFEAYKKSRLFAEIRTERVKSDLYADIVITTYEEFSRLASVACGATLLVIPCGADSTIVMETTFRDGNGAPITKIEKREQISVWAQLFLIFGFGLHVSTEQVLDSLVHATLKDAINQHIL